MPYRPIHQVLDKPYNFGPVSPVTLKTLTVRIIMSMAQALLLKKFYGTKKSAQIFSL